MEEEISAPVSVLSQDQALSLLRRYKVVTQAKFSEIADLLYCFTPDDYEGLEFTRREVSHWIRGTRTIPSQKFPVVLAFLKSDEFFEAVPEARTVFDDQDRAIEGGIFWTRMHGVDQLTPEINEVLMSVEGIWWTESGRGLPGTLPATAILGITELFNREFVLIQSCPGYSFSIAHFIDKRDIFSGFLVPRNKVINDRIAFSFDLWSRVTRMPMSYRDIAFCNDSFVFGIENVVLDNVQYKYMDNDPDIRFYEKMKEGNLPPILHIPRGLLSFCKDETLYRKLRPEEYDAHSIQPIIEIFDNIRWDVVPHGRT